MSDGIAEKTKSVGQSTFSSRLFKPGNNTLGYILFLVSLVLWAEGKNLRSVNVILVIIAIFWLAIRLLAKTKLFTKKEKDSSIVSKKRKLKLLSLIIVVLVAIMVLATTIVVNFSEDFGGDAPNTIRRITKMESSKISSLRAYLTGMHQHGIL